MRKSLRTRTTRKVPKGIFSNYCGFGGEGVPQHLVDEACEQHDYDYGLIEALFGEDAAYEQWNWADDNFVETLRRIAPQSAKEHIVKRASQSVFAFKKAIYPETKFDNPVSPELAQYNQDQITPQKRKFSPGDTPSISPVKRPKNLMPRRRDDDEDMELALGVADANGRGTSTALALASGGATGASKGNQETPVTIVNPTYGIPETHTTILPANLYFSVIAKSWTNASGRTMDIKLTSPYQFHTALTVPGDGTALANGMFSRPYYENYTAGSTVNWPALSAQDEFPVTPGSGYLIPSWRDVFEAWYDYYHVMGCHWELTMTKPYISDYESGVCVVWAYQAYKSTDSAVLPSGATLDETFAWPNVNHTIIRNQNIQNLDNTVKISGSYTPGQAHRDVVNDEDVKTWTSVSSAPSLTESLRLMFYSSPDSRIVPSGNLPQFAINCQLRIKWIIQYKDLKPAIRFPYSAATNVVTTFPDDALQG